MKAVRWMFQTFADTDMGLRAIANELNRRGITGPGTGQIRKGKPVSGKWYAGSVRSILTNEAYIGIFTYAKRTMGKYNRVSKGDVKRRDLDDYNRAKVKTNVDPCIRIEDAFEPLVERPQWEQVAKKLKSAETRNELRELIRQRLEARQQVDPAEMGGLKKRLGDVGRCKRGTSTARAQWRTSHPTKVLEGDAGSIE